MFKYLIATSLPFALLGLALYGHFSEPTEGAKIIDTSKSITPLWVFTKDVMTTCKAQLSEGKRDILASQIARIATSRLQDRQHQEAFVLLVCIESRFDNSVRSKVGAIGLTQVMPKYVETFAGGCGLGKVTPKDAEDSEVNLTLGVCNFEKLLARFDGNITMSLAGYNAGPDSPTTKKLSAGANGAVETSEYIARFAVLKEKMEGK